MILPLRKADSIAQSPQVFVYFVNFKLDMVTDSLKWNSFNTFPIRYILFKRDIK